MERVILIYKCHTTELGKSFCRAIQDKEFRDKVEDYKNGSGLQFIKFDFVPGCLA